jgi:hypothetical protein
MEDCGYSGNVQVSYDSDIACVLGNSSSSLGTIIADWKLNASSRVSGQIEGFWEDEAQAVVWK